VGAAGVFFEVDWASRTDALIRCITRNASTNTVNATGTSLATDTAIRLAIWYASASSVVFYVNGTAVFTHTTNIPAANTVNLPPAAFFEKQLGSAARCVDLAQLLYWREV
jgi:hypothetical protein